MKTYINLLFASILILFLSTSCLESGLDELPLLDGAEIKNVNFEYRYSIKNTNGFEKMEYKVLTTTTTFNGTAIDCKVKIPAPSGTFTSQIASQVNLTNIVGYFDVSLAAVVEPVENSPVLGKIGNFSQPCTYKVTAANGKSANWTLNVSLAN